MEEKHILANYLYEMHPQPNTNSVLSNHIHSFQNACIAIAAILQYLFLVAFALMTVSSVTLYWKISSFTRGMQTDKMRNTVISMLVAWGIVYTVKLLMLYMLVDLVVE